MRPRPALAEIAVERAHDDERLAAGVCTRDLGRTGPEAFEQAVVALGG